MNKKYAIVVGDNPTNNLNRLTMFTDSKNGYSRHSPFIIRYSKSEAFDQFVIENKEAFLFAKETNENGLFTVSVANFRNDNLFLRYAEEVGKKGVEFTEELLVAVARSNRGINITDFANDNFIDSDMIKFISKVLTSDVSFDMEYGFIRKKIICNIYSNLIVITDRDCFRPRPLFAIPHMSGVSNIITIASPSDQMMYLSQAALKASKQTDRVSVWELVY